ncbi:MAG: SMC-Scp complex subunit ScpB, partial [Clostridia bacterium]|nr:SMC-Scp complex subunit ScpB [Clostridia bacterium]
VLKRLSDYYTSHNSGLVLKKINDSYQLASRSSLHDELKPHFEQVSASPLSRSALEALTIIAYNQPITRGGVEIIRGVNSDSVVSTLLERGLICEKGKSDSPGRPVLYGTTELFLKSAGLSNIEELRNVIPLPDINAAQPQGDSTVSN